MYKNLCSGDIAIIAGKGHEKTQEFKGNKSFPTERNLKINYKKINFCLRI